MDSTLLKEAIADAKAVRRTALANAKVALEEAFSDRYQAMFSEKLKEEAGSDGDVTNDSQPIEGESTVSPSEIDELIAELEQEAGEGQPTEPTEPAGEVPPAPAPAPVDGMPPVPPVPGAVPATCQCQCAPGAVPPAPMGAPMGAPGEVPPAPAPAPEVPPSTPPPSDVPPVDEESQNIDLDELLESLKNEIEGEEEEDTIDEAKKLASSGIGGGKAGGSANKAPSANAKSSSDIESGGMKQEGMPSPDGTKVGPADASKAARPNKATHATKDNLSTPSVGKGGNGSGGNKESGMPNPDKPKVGPSDASEAARPNQGKNATKDNQSTSALQENITLKRQLNEAEEVIKYVKLQLNEVNLLNAKLLYTNKLFKEYNMNNEQKMRIVEMFDLSKNVREVKLTYANIAESLNFSGNDIKKVKTSPNIQSITEGLASGAVGSTKPSKAIISEGKTDQMVSKFQKLAGIKMPLKK